MRPWWDGEGPLTDAATWISPHPPPSPPLVFSSPLRRCQIKWRHGIRQRVPVRGEISGHYNDGSIMQTSFSKKKGIRSDLVHNCEQRLWEPDVNGLSSWHWSCILPCPGFDNAKGILIWRCCLWISLSLSRWVSVEHEFNHVGRTKATRAFFWLSGRDWLTLQWQRC